MKITLPKFESARVMVIGDVMLDRYWYGQTSRISPEAPVPIVKIDKVEERPGGAANVAINIATLGAYSCLVGITGADDSALVMNKILVDANVCCDFITVPTYLTTTKLRIFSRNQLLIRLDFEEVLENFNPEQIYERIVQAIDNIGVLVLSDYSKGALVRIQLIILLASDSNVPVIIDPKGTDFSHYRGATMLTPNLSEFEAVAGICKSEEDLVERGMKTIANLNLSALLVTRSELGMTLLRPEKAPLHMPTEALEVYDVTGAGDTVVSVLAATLAAGNSLEEACYFANVAAGIVVGKLGTSTVSPNELKNVVHSLVDTCFGIMTEQQLKVALSAARKRGEKTVMTNGVFDILHAGHVAYLANARNLGDRLIVAVNSDSSTKRLKGKTRPVNPLRQRMIVLNALQSVDWVVSFDDDTPLRLIASILPDLLVKGGDYRPELIAGSKEVWANGGKVVVLNFEEECSTTKIINRILQDRQDTS